MIISHRPLLLAAVAALAATALPPARLAAQQAAPAGLSVAPSGRATTQVNVAPPRVAGQPAPAPLAIRVDYGQPHARGRAIAGGLVPYDQIWRTGANASTTLTTDVDLVIGDARVPKGSYSLYSLLTRSGWTLVINRNTGQWGTEYVQAQDLARVPMRLTQLGAPAESFVMTLVPNQAPPASGTLTLMWGTLHGAVDWRVAQ